MMKLTVKNFGPIREAKDIVVGPMTVFVGPSNTGKSYLAMLIYSIVKALGESREVGEVGEMGFYLRRRHRVQDLINKMKGELATENWHNDKKIVSRVMDRLFDQWVDSVRGSWRKQVSYCFGEEAENMLEASNDLVIKISDEQDTLMFDLYSGTGSKPSTQSKKLSPAHKNKIFDTYLENKHLKELLKDYADVPGKENISDDEHIPNRHFKRRAVSVLAKILFSELDLILAPEDGTRKTQDKSHYLPAIRGGIMQSHRTLVSTVIRAAPMVGLSATSSVPPFTGVLADFLEKLINIGELVHQTSRGRNRLPRVSDRGYKKEIQEIAKELEENIMRGRTDVQKSELGYPDFRYKFERDKNEHNLPLMSASSMISELAPVSLFLEYYVRPGHLFILEEPEAHLHPGAQRDITNILVQLVNAGVHVLITTHSDIILEQLGNYVHAHEIDKKIQEQSLGKEKVATYLFGYPEKNGQKNTVVKRIDFDEEIGFLTKDHLDVSSNLYNESIDLFNAGQHLDKEKNAKSGKNNDN